MWPCGPSYLIAGCCSLPEKVVMGHCRSLICGHSTLLILMQVVVTADRRILRCVCPIKDFERLFHGVNLKVPFGCLLLNKNSVVLVSIWVALVRIL